MKSKPSLYLAGAALLLILPTVASSQDQNPFNFGPPSVFNNGSMISIITDTETGCQYIQRIFNSSVTMTPRYNSHGLPMCRESGN